VIRIRDSSIRAFTIEVFQHERDWSSAPAGSSCRGRARMHDAPVAERNSTSVIDRISVA
jgi:hypothetical protein